MLDSLHAWGGFPKRLLLGEADVTYLYKTSYNAAHRHRHIGVHYTTCKLLPPAWWCRSIAACQSVQTWKNLTYSMTKLSQSHLMLTKRDLLLVPLISIISAGMAAWWWLASTSTSVPDENAAMSWCPSAEAWKAWRNILVSASSRVLWRSAASVAIILPSKALSLVHLFR